MENCFKRNVFIYIKEELINLIFYIFINPKHVEKIFVINYPNNFLHSFNLFSIFFLDSLITFILWFYNNQLTCTFYHLKIIFLKIMIFPSSTENSHRIIIILCKYKNYFHFFFFFGQLNLFSNIFHFFWINLDVFEQYKNYHLFLP